MCLSCFPDASLTRSQNTVCVTCSHPEPNIKLPEQLDARKNKMPVKQDEVFSAPPV